MWSWRGGDSGSHKASVRRVASCCSGLFAEISTALKWWFRYAKRRRRHANARVRADECTRHVSSLQTAVLPCWASVHPASTKNDLRLSLSGTPVVAGDAGVLARRRYGTSGPVSDRACWWTVWAPSSLLTAIPARAGRNAPAAPPQDGVSARQDSGAQGVPRALERDCHTASLRGHGRPAHDFAVRAAYLCKQIPLMAFLLPLCCSCNPRPFLHGAACCERHVSPLRAAGQ